MKNYIPETANGCAECRQDISLLRNLQPHTWCRTRLPIFYRKKDSLFEPYTQHGWKVIADAQPRVPQILTNP